MNINGRKEQMRTDLQNLINQAYNSDTILQKILTSKAWEEGISTGLGQDLQNKEETEMYKFQSMKTGEIVENWKEVLKAMWIDFKHFHIINMIWKYNKKGWQ